jgi:D-xylose transport system substrate-binding protein
MGSVISGAAAIAAAAFLAVALGACADAGDSGDAGGEGLDIGLLLPDTTGRWEGFDRPIIERAVDEACGDCTVETANAQGDTALQQQQVDSMITRGIDVLILSPSDAKAIRSSVERADEAGIPVVAYDRLADGPVSAYASFDNELVGRMQGRALLQALGDRADDAQIVMMNGAPTDPNAALFRQGALDVLAGRVEIGTEYDTAGWSRDVAFANMEGAIVDLGAGEIDGVYSANDALAAGALAALNAARVEPLPPVTGQDAELTAVQLIVEGEQYMTVYKPYQLEANAAAEMAIALGRGESLERMTDETVANDTFSDIPAVLATPISVTADTIDETVVKDGLYTIDEICVPGLEAECERAGLTEE